MALRNGVDLMPKPITSIGRVMYLARSKKLKMNDMIKSIDATINVWSKKIKLSIFNTASKDPAIKNILKPNKDRLFKSNKNTWCPSNCLEKKIFPIRRIRNSDKSKPAINLVCFLKKNKTDSKTYMVNS